MNNNCESGILFSGIEILLRKISDENSLDSGEARRLSDLLDKYWDIECPSDAQYCLPNHCSFAKPIDWVEYHGYTCLAELLYYFEYDNLEGLKIKDKKGIDTLDAHWGRRSGHFNP